MLCNNLEYVLCTHGQELVEVCKNRYLLRLPLRQPCSNKYCTYCFPMAAVPSDLCRSSRSPLHRASEVSSSSSRPRDSRRIKAVHIDPRVNSTPLANSKFLLSGSHCPAIIGPEQSYSAGRNDFGKIISQTAHHQTILVPCPEIPLAALSLQMCHVEGLLYCDTLQQPLKHPTTGNTTQHYKIKGSKTPSSPLDSSVTTEKSMWSSKGRTF